MAGMKNVFRLSNLRFLSFLIAVFLSMPFTWRGLTGFYNWFSPFIMLNSLLVLKSFVWLNIISILILIIATYRKRWFCHHLCPVGWSCDQISRLSNKDKFRAGRLPDISRWTAIISLAAAIVGVPLLIIADPMAIFNGFFTLFSGKLSLASVISLALFPLLLLLHLYYPGIWCNKLCPLGGLQLLISDIKTLAIRLFNREEKEAIVTDPARRYFVMSGVGLLAGLFIPRILKPSDEVYIRPPASVDNELFNSLCCRCGSCNKVCPTGIIKPQTDMNNLLGWMTPVVTFRNGYCLETCNLCSRVCPSGAITLFDTDAKQQLFMGTAKVNISNCLLAMNRECVKCKESCKYNALEFKASENILYAIPVISITKCVGCGACEVVCPQSCIEIKPYQMA
jgi:ferredoxin-type protein NapF